jgi:hypothetical protein
MESVHQKERLIQESVDEQNGDELAKHEDLRICKGM